MTMCNNTPPLTDIDTDCKASNYATKAIEIPRQTIERACWCLFQQLKRIPTAIELLELAIKFEHGDGCVIVMDSRTRNAFKKATIPIIEEILKPYFDGGATIYVGTGDENTFHSPRNYLGRVWTWNKNKKLYVSGHSDIVLTTAQVKEMLKSGVLVKL